MKVKLSLPENISEITLRQFIKYDELQGRNLEGLHYIKRKISIFTDIPFNQIGNIKHNDAQRILTQIDKALTTEVNFTNTFTMHGIEFGFIPDLDSMSISEYASLSLYGVDKNELHNLMAVLFRPITKKIDSKYEIMAYEGTEQYAEMMKDMPLNVVNGALVFFWSLANELQEATLKYLTEELRKDMRPKRYSRILDGIRRLRSWRMTTSLSWTR